MTKAASLGIAVGLALLALAAFGTMLKPRPESWNDMSRVAAIESLVERGTWSIDDSPWTELTADKVWLNGRFYSDKMPLLSALGAGAYALLRSIGGASLASDCGTAGHPCAYPWLTFLLVAVPAATMVGLYFLFELRVYAARQKNPAGWAALLAASVLALALAFGTMIWPYSTVFNHHVPAAVCLFASLYLLTQRTGREALFGAGLFAALAVSFDALAGILAASLFASALFRGRSRVLWFVLGGVLPVLVTALLDYQIAGTVIPPYLITQGYNYPESQFPTTVGGNGVADDLPRYAFRLLFGAQGLYGYNPLLLIGLAGIVIAALHRASDLHWEAALIGAGFLALSVYLMFNTGNYGGIAYGERWFVNALPLVLAFLPFVLPVGPLRPSLLMWPLMLAALALSVYSSYQGAVHTWQYTPPPVQLTWKTGALEFGWKLNVQLPLR